MVTTISSVKLRQGPGFPSRTRICSDKLRSLVIRRVYPKQRRVHKEGQSLVLRVFLRAEVHEELRLLGRDYPCFWARSVGIVRWGKPPNRSARRRRVSTQFVQAFFLPYAVTLAPTLVRELERVCSMTEARGVPVQSTSTIFYSVI